MFYLVVCYYFNMKFKFHLFIFQDLIIASSCSSVDHVANLPWFIVYINICQYFFNFCNQNDLYYEKKKNRGNLDLQGLFQYIYFCKFYFSKKSSLHYFFNPSLSSIHFIYSSNYSAVNSQLLSLFRHCLVLSIWCLLKRKLIWDETVKNTSRIFKVHSKGWFILSGPECIGHRTFPFMQHCVFTTPKWSDTKRVTFV